MSSASTERYCTRRTERTIRRITTMTMATMRAVKRKPSIPGVTSAWSSPGRSVGSTTPGCSEAPVDGLGAAEGDTAGTTVGRKAVTVVQSTGAARAQRRPVNRSVSGRVVSTRESIST